MGQQCTCCRFYVNTEINIKCSEVPWHITANQPTINSQLLTYNYSAEESQTQSKYYQLNWLPLMLQDFGLLRGFPTVSKRGSFNHIGAGIMNNVFKRNEAVIGNNFFAYYSYTCTI